MRKSHLVHEERDFGFSSVLMEARKKSRLAWNLRGLCQTAQTRVCSGRQTKEVENGPVVGYHGSLKKDQKDQKDHAVEIDPKQSHRRRELDQGQSGTCAPVATVRSSRNGGRWAGSDAPVRDNDSFLDLDLTLDLCACPYHGDRGGLGRHSTDLSAPDSYGTQP